MADIKVYGAPWCPDCERSKKFLAEHRGSFAWLDIDQDREARLQVWAFLAKPSPGTMHRD